MDAYADLLGHARDCSPRVAIVLGSGWGGLAARCRVACALSYLDVPDLAATSIPGHAGSVLLGRWAGRAVVIFSGRLHHYEGHAWRKVVQPIHLARAMGAEVVVLTNAAGGIRSDLAAGSLMAITGHLSWVGAEGWRFLAQEREKGGQAPGVQSTPYCPALREKLEEAARALALSLTSGVYAQVTGPTYETCAEVRALRVCGADAVGMSTGKEAETAAALGMRCLGLSCITNAGAGLAGGPIHHGDVTAVAAERAHALGDLLEGWLRRVD